MEIISSAELQHNLLRFRDHAVLEPVMVVDEGHETVVLISAEEFKRYRRFDRQVLRPEDFTEEELALLAVSEVPAEYAYLDAELDE